MNKGFEIGSCILEEDINKCKDYDASNQACKSNNKQCCMFNRNINRYIRKPRWYEKYYKKGSFIS